MEESMSLQPEVSILMVNYHTRGRVAALSAIIGLSAGCGL